MNKKRIANHLNKLINDWCESIKDKDLVDIIKNNVIITGGSIVSLINSDDINDYDIYFKTKEACEKVFDYYIKQHNASVNNTNGNISYQFDDTKSRFFVYDSSGRTTVGIKGEKGKFHLKYISNNAITLSDKVQIVIRFWGDLKEIHKNYDYIHCTCGYDYKSEYVYLPSCALEAIINKELVYTGSKYPLCSIIRTRKFIERGWHINAGQYLKICLQLNDLDLKNVEVLQDQLIGVDSAYFEEFLKEFRLWQEETDGKVDNTYLFELIDKIF